MIKDLEAYCRFFFASTGIPVSCCWLSGELVYSFPDMPGDLPLFKNTFILAHHLKKNPDYYFAQSSCHFGSVIAKEQEAVITIGPVFSTPVTDTAVHHFMLEWAIDAKYREELVQILCSAPLMSASRFFQTLALIHLSLNGETLDISSHFGLNDLNQIHKLSGPHSDQVIHAREIQRFHNTYQFEQQLSQYIQNGDPVKLKKLLNTAASLHGGIIADNALRQEKNIFIVATTLSTRSAIAGGMDMEQAYLLSDLYIQECERSQSIPEISSLTYAMHVDFAERVGQTKIPQGMSPEIFQCIQFISNHINEPISVGDVAEHIGKSRSYLTAQFKKELGFNISHFILRYKLEEAKSLLTYSDKSLSEISSYLAFSSQSHFQNVFKNKYGVTPLQYRSQSRQEMAARGRG